VAARSIAIDNEIEHHAIRADLKQFVKSLEDTTARNRYMLINQGYEKLMQLTTRN